MAVWHTEAILACFWWLFQLVELWLKQCQFTTHTIFYGISNVWGLPNSRMLQELGNSWQMDCARPGGSCIWAADKRRQACQVLSLTPAHLTGSLHSAFGKQIIIQTPQLKGCTDSIFSIIIPSTLAMPCHSNSTISVILLLPQAHRAGLIRLSLFTPFLGLSQYNSIFTYTRSDMPNPISKTVNPRPCDPQRKTKKIQKCLGNIEVR